MLKIIYEDNHLIVINKPAGVLVQGDITQDQSLDVMVKEYIKKKYKKPGEVYLGVVHRLDRPVSGVVLFAKTSKALTRLNKQFKERQVKKKYLAVVDKRPEKLSGELVNFLVKSQERNIVKAHNKEVKYSKRAVLHYDYISMGNHRFLLKVNPITGRPHQIRVQLAKMGCPIDGDLKYGSKKGRDNMIHLHSRSLEITHPTLKEKMIFEAPMPSNNNWVFFKDCDD